MINRQIKGTHFRILEFLCIEVVVSISEKKTSRSPTLAKSFFLLSSANYDGFFFPQKTSEAPFASRLGEGPILCSHRGVVAVWDLCGGSHLRMTKEKVGKLWYIYQP